MAAILSRGDELTAIISQVKRQSHEGNFTSDISAMNDQN